MPTLGAHVSAAGSLHLAFERAREIGCDCLQIFVKNANQWRAKPLEAKAVEAFRDTREREGTPPVVAHAAYLINLCAADPDVLEKSRQALRDELERSHTLGLDALIVHPGAHMGAGEKAALALIARSIAEILEQLDGHGVRLLLENTAGQGTTLGASFTHLGQVLDAVGAGSELGVCLDTCHAFAAGFELTTKKGFEEMISELDAAIGTDRLACIHLNDSKHKLGSRKDRHANIGDGEIGTEPFRRIIHDHSLAHLPMILETPLGDDRQGHKRDLETLRAL